MSTPIVIHQEQSNDPLPTAESLLSSVVSAEHERNRVGIAQFWDHFESAIGTAGNIGIRITAGGVFLLYLLSGNNVARSSLIHFPAWLHWSLLLLIGAYGWWETSLFIQRSNRQSLAGKPSEVREQTKNERGPRITLLIQTPEHLRLLLEGVAVYENRFQTRVAEGVREFLVGPEVSSDFLARLKESAAPDPWKDGFAIFHNADKVVIGLCGFTGPPGAEGTVEIAYGIAPTYQNRGYAGETAHELVAFAVASGKVRTICAHTLPENSASTRVLTKCGFIRTGEVTHPEDGLVWRWEMQPKMA